MSNGIRISLLAVGLLLLVVAAGVWFGSSADAPVVVEEAAVKVRDDVVEKEAIDPRSKVKRTGGSGLDVGLPAGIEGVGGETGESDGDVEVSGNPEVVETSDVAEPVSRGQLSGVAKQLRPVSAVKDHIRGDTNAPVTIIEYGDLECPFCKRMHGVLTQLLAARSGDVRWVWRHYPLPVHTHAREKAMAAECAAKTGQLWEYVDAVYAAGTDIPVGRIKEIARELPIFDLAGFDSCVDSESTAEAVDADFRDATLAGARGTPHMVIIFPDGTSQALAGLTSYDTLFDAVAEAVGR